MAVDDATLKTICSQPMANMLLTQIDIYVLPEHLWSMVDAKAAANTFRNPPPIVGSGPFQTAEFKKDEYVKMVRNPSYRGSRPAALESFARTETAYVTC